MKSGIRQVTGKTISSVVITENDKRSPRNQVFLVFTDDTYFEIWGDSFTCAGGVDRGTAKDAINYAESMGAHVVNVYSRLDIQTDSNH